MKTTLEKMYNLGEAELGEIFNYINELNDDSEVEPLFLSTIVKISEHFGYETDESVIAWVFYSQASLYDPKIKCGFERARILLNGTIWNN